MPRMKQSPVVSPAKVPRKTPRQRLSETPSPDVESVPVSSAAATMAEDLSGESVLLFAGVPNLERVKVFREDERTKKPVFHGNLAVEETTIDRVTELFGGGKYVLRATQRDRIGAEVYAAGRTITVPGAYKPVMGPLPGVGIATAPGVPGAAPGYVGASSGTELRELMESALAGKLMDLLKGTPSVPVVAPTDWSKLATAAATLLTAVMPLLESRNKGEPMLLTLFQQMQEDMKALKNQPTPQATGMKDLLSTIRGMAELKDVLSGTESSKEGGDNPMWNMASKALEILSGRAGVPAPVPDDPAVVGSIPVATMQPWQQLVSEYAPRLIDSAQRGIEPELVAELVSRYVPEHQRGTLMELVHQPDVGRLIVSVVPVMSNYPAWLASFAVACRAELLGTDEPEPPEETA